MKALEICYTNDGETSTVTIHEHGLNYLEKIGILEALKIRIYNENNGFIPEKKKPELTIRQQYLKDVPDNVRDYFDDELLLTMPGSEPVKHSEISIQEAINSKLGTWAISRGMLHKWLYWFAMVHDLNINAHIKPELKDGEYYPRDREGDKDYVSFYDGASANAAHEYAKKVVFSIVPPLAAEWFDELLGPGEKNGLDGTKQRIFIELFYFFKESSTASYDRITKATFEKWLEAWALYHEYRTEYTTYKRKRYVAIIYKPESK